MTHKINFKENWTHLSIAKICIAKTHQSINQDNLCTPCGKKNYTENFLMCKCFQMYINYCFKYPPSAPNFAMISSWVTSICTHGKFKRKTLAQRLTIDMIQIEHSLHDAWSEPIKFLHHTFVPLFAILERYLAASLSNSCANLTAICVNCNSHWSTPGHGSRISLNKNG